MLVTQETNTTVYVASPRPLVWSCVAAAVSVLPTASLVILNTVRCNVAVIGVTDVIMFSARSLAASLVRASVVVRPVLTVVKVGSCPCPTS